MLPKEGRFIRATFVSSNIRTGGRGHYETQKHWEDAKVHLLLELDLCLGDQVQRLRLATDEDSKGVSKEMKVYETLQLGSGEKVLGFQMHEVKSQHNGGTLYFNVQAILQSKDCVWLEPLSREVFPMSYPFPGQPNSLRGLASDQTEVTSLRAFHGRQRHHITGLKYKFEMNIECATGQSKVFWMELMVFAVGFYYLDVATDLQQLTLFYSEGKFDYLALNCLGVGVPMLTTMIEAVQWSESKVARPQCDMFRRLVPSRGVRILLILSCVLTQCHMLVLAVASALMRSKHDLLLCAKHAEVAEAIVSACLQSNFLLLIVVGIESVSQQAFRALGVSVLISCLSLAFGLASRDKQDSRVLHVPGKLSWSPTLAALILVRALEVMSRLLAINIVHFSTRLAVPLGGPAAVVLLAASAWYFFPEADRSQIFAAVIAHPGQVMLGSRSMLPLRWSLRIHVLLPVVAICLQGVQLNSNLFPEAQIMSWPWFAMSVATCISSTLGLLVLHSLGNQMGHPVLEQIGKGQPLACTMLATASEESVVPLPLLAAAETVLLDLEALKSPNILQKLASASATQVVVPASSMRELQPMLQKQLEELSCINVIDIDLSECDFESHWSSVWDRLHWPLKVARRVRGKHDKKEVVAIIAKLANCKLLEELVFVDCYFEFSGPDALQEQLKAAQWPKLRKVSWIHETCQQGPEETAEETAAAAVLKALGRFSKIEVLNFQGLRWLSNEAWDQHLVQNPWVNLRWELCNFGCNKEGEVCAPQQLQKIEKVHFISHVTSKTSQMLLPKCPIHVVMKQGDALLPRLAQGQCLQLLDAAAGVHRCRTSAEAWECLRKAQWPHLKEANLSFCFPRSEGQGASTVLRLMVQCRQLVNVNLSNCQGISTDAWHLLGNAEWPELKIANFSFCFENDPAQPVLQMLARCRKLTSLKLLRCGVTVEHLRALPKGCWPCLSPEACAFDGDLGRFAAARAMAAPGPEGLDADADAVAVDVDVEDVDRSPARKSRRVRRVRRKRSTVTGERESSKESEMVPSSSAQVEGESESDLASTRPKGRKPKKKGVVKVRRVRRKDSQ
ncbi:unnamed protein product [Durusdinium trenchii]|uniref:Uncharacterized protein n=2 Tax=Durusdinium trenchii TaxID=1381693 RepID=A0ABP0JCP0_9DINO